MGLDPSQPLVRKLSSACWNCEIQSIGSVNSTAIGNLLHCYMRVTRSGANATVPPKQVTPLPVEPRLKDRGRPSGSGAAARPPGSWAARHRLLVGADQVAEGNVSQQIPGGWPATVSPGPEW